jgi:type II secretory pathway predicted ATPase ExeA
MSRRPDQLTHPPIGLRTALRVSGVSMRALARLCAGVRGRNGQTISQTSLHYLARNGLWPSGYDVDQLREVIETALRNLGVSTAGIWEPEADTSGSEPRNHETPDPNQEGVTQPIPEPEMLSEAARRHFGLARHPFVNEIDGPQDLMFSRDARYVREAMYYAAKHCGFLAVIGESGAGKSVLRKDLIERLKRGDENVTVVQPKVPDKSQLTAHHICHAILADISVQTPKASLEALARQVERALLDSAAAGRTHVLLIEEAHDLTISALKYLKRFWEIEDGFRKLIGIVLIGQTELSQLLDERHNPKLREVIRRCEVATLRPLGDDVRAYVEHKLRRVMDKSRGLETVMDPGALDAVRQRLLWPRQGSKVPEDQSYPLNVHNLVVRAMNAAVDLGYERVTAELVREA